MSSQPID